MNAGAVTATSGGCAIAEGDCADAGGNEGGVAVAAGGDMAGTSEAAGEFGYVGKISAGVNGFTAVAGGAVGVGGAEVCHTRTLHPRSDTVNTQCRDIHQFCRRAAKSYGELGQRGRRRVPAVLQAGDRDALHTCTLG